MESWLKPWIWLLFLATLLLGGAWAVLRFQPDLVRFSDSAATLDPQKLALEAQHLRDSLDALNLAIRTNTDQNSLPLLKERQTYFWKKLEGVRKAAESAVPNKPSEEDEFQGLVKLLTQVLTITAIVLVVVIGFLLWMLRRRKAEVTRRLEALKGDARFKSPRGGFDATLAQLSNPGDDPTLAQPKRRPDSLAGKADPRHARQRAVAASMNLDPDENYMPKAARQAYQDASRAKESDDFSTTPVDALPGLTQSSASSNSRPTARQKVTKALKGLAEALAVLNEDRAGKDKGTKSRRALSQNTIPDAQPLQATRFDKEKEEKADIVKLARRGYTGSEIARRLRLPQDQVETVIRLQRESGE